MLRHALQHHSYQLHNQLPPIHTLPVEVLSYIFRLLVVTDHYCYWDFEKCLRQAIALGSVSFYFRHVAFGTPELWNKIKIQINHEEEVGSAASLIRHCIALTPTINIAICIKLSWDYWEEDLLAVVDALLTPDTTSKIRFLMLSDTRNFWCDIINASSFPMLDALCISPEENHDDFIFDLGMLTTVTRISINARYLGCGTTLPLSVQYLDLNDVPQDALIPLLRQCPNLVECNVAIERQGWGSDDDFWGSDDDFDDIVPLRTLAKLERLTCTNMDGISIAQNLGLPSVKFLKIVEYKNNAYYSAIPLIRRIKKTLTTLVINGFNKAFRYGDALPELCKISFPKLETLEFYSNVPKPFSNAVRASAWLEDKCKKSTRRKFPALRSIVLGYGADDIDPRSLLDLLEEWEIGEVFYFDIQFDAVDLIRHQWSPELREELRSIVGNRRIEVTWGMDKVHELGV